MKTSKLFINILIAIALTAGMISCGQFGQKDTGPTAQEDNVKYYRHILFSETPWDVIQGTYPITAEEAKTVNNYKFTYDDLGRPVTIEFNRNGELLEYSSLGAARINIDYDGVHETHTYFDKDGKPKKVSSGTVFKSVYLLDDDGMRIGLNFYNEEGLEVENRNKIASYTWSKLPNGMIKENRFNLLGMEVILNEFCPFYELRFTYDENGYVKRMANYQADTLYNCIAENCGDIGVSYFTFDMSEKGDLEKFTVYSTTGQLSNLYWGWAKFINEYDEHGNVIERAYYDQDDEYLGGKSNPVSQYAYDEHGSIVEVKVLDKERNLINHPDRGHAITRFVYDDLGHPTDTLRYDKDMAAL